MKMLISEELKSIFYEINEENKSLSEWAEIESDDMFQTKNYCGGFDAIENAFCFSYYDENNKEYWFQLSLDEVAKAIKDEIKEIEIRPAE